MSWIISNALMQKFENSSPSLDLAKESQKGNLECELYCAKEKVDAFTKNFQSGATLKDLGCNLADDLLTWYLDGLHSEVSNPLQECGSPSKISDNPWIGESVKFDTISKTWKTTQCLFEEDLPESSVTLPKWGKMVNGELWKREKPNLSIKSKLPQTGDERNFYTPTCADATVGAILDENTQLVTGKSGIVRKLTNNGVSGSLGLARQVTLLVSQNVQEPKTQNTLKDDVDATLWPTPSSTGGRSVGQILQMRKIVEAGFITKEEAEDMIGGSINPKRMEEWKMASHEEDESLNNTIDGTGRGQAEGKTHTFPSPGTTGLSNGSGNCAKANKLYEIGVITEEERKSFRAGNGGKLNPDWVELLMGWPVGWTSLTPMSKDVFDDWLKTNQADAWLDGSWDYGVPKITKNKTNRINRLKAIGNGQVPQCLILAFNHLSE